MAETVILKLGGSIITRKAEGRLEVDEKNLARLAEETAQALTKPGLKLVVVHGAGPFGHVLAEKYGLAEEKSNPMKIKGMAETHASMEKLNAAVVSALARAGVAAIAFQPSAGGIMDNRVLVEFPVKVVKEMLDRNLTPVGYGDVLVDRKTGVNILSGDHLVPYLAEKIPASRVVIATDVDGIYSGDPKDGGNPVK
ncbi:uridylate kinase, partial [Patescibacteria group bacterium]|nr:uridylate kinase [Patescibacteria group bacterium]